ncbi:LOW QUALITY PROTEIN: hypothetical protein PanWU01x14_265680 [Parasponia andersonii]|uniref:Uncharacterized protein n=1 Tax=Parasponia andersonii TaxID=3476 RepID=A0A2P5B732_PARAD|nr:LOW QUALITY PROTEIN: hypothetical protein PanWU01x14_265680 [Parasponia andersonii]
MMINRKLSENIHSNISLHSYHLLQVVDGLISFPTVEL